MVDATGRGMECVGMGALSAAQSGVTLDGELPLVSAGAVWVSNSSGLNPPALQPPVSKPAWFGL